MVYIVFFPPVVQYFEEGVGDECVCTCEETGLEVWGGRVSAGVDVNFEEEGAVVGEINSESKVCAQVYQM